MASCLPEEQSEYLQKLANADCDESSEDDDELLKENIGERNEVYAFPQATCWICNGYYGPNFDEPLCSTCHAFLHSSSTVEDRETTRFSDSDEDSGNDEPPFKDKQEDEEGDEENDDDVDDDENVVGDDDDENDDDDDDDDDDEDVILDAAENLDDVDMIDAQQEQHLQQDQQQQQLPAGNKENIANQQPLEIHPGAQEPSGSVALSPQQRELMERANNLQFLLPIQRPNLQPPRDLHYYLGVLSDQPANAQAEANFPVVAMQNISNLPVELLVIIFSHLDDMSMWKASEVCKTWQKIIKNNTSQLMWKKYLKERWPLFQNIAEVNDWFSLYGALMSSCFCRTCLLQMASKTPNNSQQQQQDYHNAIRTKNLRLDSRHLNSCAPEGIEAIPLDEQNSYWQASILGPVGSPYEGGKFFLYIFVPDGYPMIPPTVRFLTKIIHPNVSRHGDVGLDIFQHRWSSALNVIKVLLSVQSLLTDPFTKICMEPEIGYMYEHNRYRFENLARTWTWKYAMFELMPPRQ